MKINWDDHEVLPAQGIALSRRFAYGQEMSCLRVEASEEGDLNLPPHWHTNEQWVVVTEGSIRFVCEGKEYELNAGDVAYIPSGQKHTATYVGPKGAVLLELSAPPRMDLAPGSLVPSSMKFDD
ncbi:cupin domain-containing protein [Streptomyces sp. NPDC093586]|uniref:cupin domain-containing protein n=1 Tax=Streptomyces sp. NPDC093586 TaxID=3366042 RepID=UPI00382B926E